MALGAEPGRVLRMVLGAAWWLTMVGILAGLGAALSMGVGLVAQGAPADSHRKRGLVAQPAAPQSLPGPVRPGDRLLVHAGTAIGRAAA